MSRVATLVASFGVGSLHIGLKDLTGTEQRLSIQFEANSPFFAKLYATNNFDFVANVGSNWVDVTNRVFRDQGVTDPDFVNIGGFFQLQRQANAQEIVSRGMYPFELGFIPAAIQIDVTSVSSGDPLGIFFAM